MTRPGKLAAVWRAAGFRDVRDTALTVRMDYADFENDQQPFVDRQGPVADDVASLDAATLGRLRRAYLDGGAGLPPLLRRDRLGGARRHARLIAI